MDTTTEQPPKRGRGRPKTVRPPGWTRPAHYTRPVSERSAHGHLCSIWRSLAYQTKHNSPTRAKLAAYVEGPAFVTAFNALDPKRRALAMQAVARAYAAFGPKPHRPQFRVRWTDELKERLKEAAKKAPDNLALADTLMLPYEAAKRMRFDLLGRIQVPHISQRGPYCVKAA